MKKLFNKLLLLGTVLIFAQNAFAQTYVPNVDRTVAAEFTGAEGTPEYKLGQMIDDDHLALNRVGIPTIDIIDFDYPHWHRLSDVVDNCSGEAMKDMAKVLSAWMRKAK